MSLYFAMSLSRCATATNLEPSVPHGEKFLNQTMARETMMIQPTHGTLSKKSSYRSLFADRIYVPEKLMEDDWETEDYICVNPYEVNPVIEKKPDSGLRTAAPKHQTKKDTQCSLAKPGGHGFSVTNPVKLEMEEFRDLSTFLLPKPLSINSVDELNTPVFAKDAFDFDIFSTQKDSCSNDIKVKLEHDAYYGNLSTTEKSIDFSAVTPNMHRKENILCGVTNVHLQSPQQQKQTCNNNLNMFSPSPDNGSAYNYNISSPNSVDTTCAVSVGHYDRHYLNESLTSTKDNGFMTPEDSNSSMKEEKPHLMLNFDLNGQSVTDDLATPVIIDGIVDLESSNFNILDLVTNEDMSYLANGDIFNNPSSVSTITLPSQQEEATKITDPGLPEKHARKRKGYDDDDIDYIPPIKQRSGRKKSCHYSDSESDSEEERPRRGRPRGRPPRRTESVSSDGDASKYRELRDKNNEASRKSRLKRKCKELELEKEADELNSKNIKLKAQVEELEKMVTNFRENLFKIMIKK